MHALGGKGVRDVFAHACAGCGHQGKFAGDSEIHVINLYGGESRVTERMSRKIARLQNRFPLLPDAILQGLAGFGHQRKLLEMVERTAGVDDGFGRKRRAIGVGE